MMKVYCYKLKLCKRLYLDSAWTLIDNQAVHDHFERIKQDFENGKILHVGRTLDPTKDGFGLVIYKAENDEEALNYMLGDACIKGGQMTGTYHEYKLIFQNSISGDI